MRVGQLCAARDILALTASSINSQTHHTAIIKTACAPSTEQKPHNSVLFMHSEHHGTHPNNHSLL